MCIAVVFVLALTADHAWADDGNCDPDCTTTTTEPTTTTTAQSGSGGGGSSGGSGGGGDTTTTTSTTVRERTTTTTRRDDSTTTTTAVVEDGGPPLPPPSDGGGSSTASSPATQASPFRAPFRGGPAWAPPFAALPSAGTTTSTDVVTVDVADSHLATVGERARASSEGPAISRIGADIGGSAASILTWIVAILLGLGVFAGILRLDRHWSKE